MLFRLGIADQSGCQYFEASRRWSQSAPAPKLVINDWCQNWTTLSGCGAVYRCQLCKLVADSFLWISQSQTDTELQQGTTATRVTSLQPGRQQWGKWEEVSSIDFLWIYFRPDNWSSLVHMNADYRETRKAPTKCWWPKHIFKRYPFHSHGMLKSQSMFPLSVPRVIESEVSSKSQYTSSHHKVVVFNFDIDLLPHNWQYSS